MNSQSPVKTSGVKRKSCEGSSDKPVCKYGKDCYRKNPTHLQEFAHPARNDNTSEHGKRCKVQAGTSTGLPTVLNPFFFSTVKGIDDNFNDRNTAVSLEGILEDNSKYLEGSVQFNFMFEIPWLIKQYPLCARGKPLLLVHGFTRAENAGIEKEAKKYKNIELAQAKLPIPYGTHHSKMMFLLYSVGFRVIIHTANLIEKDWLQKTQGIWISPLFSIKSSTYSEESDFFKQGLLDYLAMYEDPKISKWTTLIKDYDMSSAKAHLVASVPGCHLGGSAMNKWGHLRLRHLLSKYGPDKSLVTKDWPVVGQFSSIGSLGDDSSKWLCSEWLRSLACCKGDKFIPGLGKSNNNLKLIYPTIQNVRDSLEGYSAGGSLPYGVQMAMKQRYLKEHLCQWASTNIGRSLAIPHIKSYTRISPDSKSSPWFLLTSANLSKAAWGVYEKKESQLMIRSYEIGVLLLPEEKTDGSQSLYYVKPSKKGTKENTLNLPYDVPLSPYSPTDKPWVWDIKYTTEDSHGRLWIPS